MTVNRSKARVRLCKNYEKRSALKLLLVFEIQGKNEEDIHLDTGLRLHSTNHSKA